MKPSDSHFSPDNEERTPLEELAAGLSAGPLIALAAAMAAIGDDPGRARAMHRNLRRLRRRRLDRKSDIGSIDAHIRMIEARIRRTRGRSNP